MISKADKGNTTVVMDKTDYDKRLLTMLEDNTTYQKLQKDPTPNTEKTVNKFVSQLVADNKITKIQSYRLKSSNGRAPVLYGLPKLHKENTPLRPIVSFTGSPTYNLSKDLARILSELTGKSDHHVRNSKDFAKFITSITINDDEQMVSFDVVSLFTKIPTGLAVEIAKSRLEALDNLEEITSWSVENICKGLQICLNATDLTFRGKHYKQIFGTAMGSPVSIVIANLIMEDVEKRALSTFHSPPKVWKRYVDDTFVIIHKNSVEDFLDHLNTIENSIKFTIEKEADHTLPFLDTLVRRNQHGKFSTSVYRKPTNSNRYLNFRSDHPLEHKQSVVRSLIDRANALCSTTKNRQDELKHVKDTLKLNSYPNTTLIKKPSNRTEQQFKGFAIIPYYPGLTEKIRRCLSNHNGKTVQHHWQETRSSQRLSGP